MDQGDVIALAVTAGAEGAAPAEKDVSRYSARSSPRNDEESHATILANARRSGEEASPESGAERGGPPAAWRAKRAQAAGLTGRSSTTTAAAASTHLAAQE
jgi:hypothetical protein